jgi:hypothetical protein
MILPGKRAIWPYLAVLLVATAFQIFTLNAYVEYYDSFWPRFVIPVLLLISIVGMASDVRGATAVGVLTAALFVCAAFVTSIPDPEIAKPRVSGHFLVNLRYFLIFVSATIWLCCFLKLRARWRRPEIGAAE